VKFGQIIRSARTKSGLSLRESARQSHIVASVLGDERYAVSPSSLCDYELLSLPPRDFHKAITLCSLYGLRFQAFAEAIGITLEENGSEPMPDHFLSRFPRRDADANFGDKSDDEAFLEPIFEQFKEVPFFLRKSVGAFSGMEEVSLDNFFWIGGSQEALSPYLEAGLLVIVNRRKKKPFYFPSKPLWQQPLYLLLRRGGTYFCACCGIENGNLVIHPHGRTFHRSEQLRHHQDIEVMGQVVAIVRKLM
jgi:hypothetical protein